jgi:hypothetical protein
MTKLVVVAHSANWETLKYLRLPLDTYLLARDNDVPVYKMNLQIWVMIFAQV